MKICINEDCRAELADGAEFCPDCNTKQAVGSEGKNGEEQTITGRRAARDLIRIARGEENAKKRQEKGGPKANQSCTKCKFHEKRSDARWCEFRNRPPYAGRCNNWVPV